MRCSLFGKLPAKRDFIALFSPRIFLDVWEPWIQGSISASRQELGEDWQNAFLTAPIWRFWLGAELCRTPVAGALMSSMDGVGRYHPLTVFAVSDAGTAIAPPDLDAQDGWYAAAEDFLLSTLDKDTAYDTITAALDQLAPPASQATNAPVDGMMLPRRTDVHLPIYSGTCGRPTMSTLTLPRASGGRWGAAIMLRMPCVAAGCPTRLCSRIC